MNEPPNRPPTFTPGVAPGYVPGPPTSPPSGSLPPPTVAAVDYGQPQFINKQPKVRPWWGLGDALLGVVFILAFAVLGLILGILVAAATGQLDFDSSDVDLLQDNLSASVAVIVIGGGAQQLAQFAWPFIVGKWKGFGAALDFGFRFKWIDLPIGLATGIAALIASGLVGNGLAWLMDVDPSDADNTAFLSDNTDSPWLWGLIFITVIGAPFSEEILFRGLLLRAFEKRSGWVAGLVGSSVIFMAVHYQPMTPSEVAVLFAAIGTAGAVFGSVAIKTGRLGGPIVAHMLFNGVAVSAVLLT